MESEQLLQCPYDKNHQIRHSRFPYHLVKCRQNHPEKVNELATCPFNARHRVPRKELKLHTDTCTDRKGEDVLEEFQFKVNAAQAVSASSWECPTGDENWDEEYDYTAQVTPFIFGSSGNSSSVIQSPEEQRSRMNSSPWQPAAPRGMKEYDHVAQVTPLMFGSSGNSSSVIRSPEEQRSRMNSSPWQSAAARGQKGLF